MTVEALNSSSEAKQDRFQDFVNNDAIMPAIQLPPIFLHTFEAPPDGAKIQEVRQRMSQVLGTSAMHMVIICASELLTNSYLHNRPYAVTIGEASDSKKPL